jgi:hypothetical protein
MGPHRMIALGAAELAASQRRVVRKLGARRGLGRVFESSEGTDRLCRSRAGLHSWRPEPRCEMEKTRERKKWGFR